MSWITLQNQICTTKYGAISLVFGTICTSEIRRWSAASLLIVLAASEVDAASDGNLVAGVTVTEPIALTDASAESYIISGHYNDNTGLTENATFILSIDGDTDLTVGGGGTLMGATTPVTNATGTITQVTATQLVFSTPLADAGAQDVTDEVVSASAYATQPIVEAQDAGGNTDANFNENITITKTVGGGTLGGTAT